MNNQSPRRGFTLVEMLVVVGIIVILMGMIIPAVMRVRDAAHKVQCTNNLKQIGVALHHYHTAHRVLPPGCSYRDGKDPYPHMSWCTRLLPFLERDEEWRQAEKAFAQERFFRKDSTTHRFGHVCAGFWLSI